MDEFEQKMRAYIRNEITGQVFAEWFEKESNFGTLDGIPRERLGVYRRIFDKIVYFTPFDEEKKIYPGYVTDDQMRQLVEHALEHLPPHR